MLKEMNHQGGKKDPIVFYFNEIQIKNINFFDFYKMVLRITWMNE